MTVNEYIKNNWATTLRDPSVFIEGNVPLPKPFNVPSLDGTYNSLFYWDTYFLNLGLIEDGMFEQAKNNIENMAYLIGELGYMPNSSKLTFASQPPFFALGVYDLYAHTKDKSLAVSFLGAMKKEHEFFTSKRGTPIGFNKYGCDLGEERLKKGYNYFSRRLNVDIVDDSEKVDFARRLYGICESGWDVTPRFDRVGRQYATDEFAPVDLNCLLYDMECKIALFASWAGDAKTEKEYADYAAKRKALIEKYMLDKTSNLFYDYNFKRNELSSVLSAASFFPYVFGVSDDKDGLKATLEKLEFPCGISACEKHENGGLQWDYPLMWPSNVWAAFVALKRLGLDKDAKRVAKKYIDSVDETFEKTGTLWEKYDAENGYLGTPEREGKASKMLGWTGGVYKFLSNR